MSKRLGRIAHYIYIYGVFAKNNLIGFMEYRANFYASLTMEMVFLLSKLVYLLFAYNFGGSINGMSPDQLMLYTGVYTIMIAIYTGAFMENLFGMSALVNNGTLDMFLTKPLSLLFMVSLRRMNFALPIPNLVAGLTMLITAWRRLGNPVNAMNILGLMGIILSSTIVMYSIFMIPQALSFWFVKSTALTELSDKTWDLNNMPMTIYSEPIRRIGMFFLPILFMTNMPTLYLIGRMTLTYTVWVCVAPVVFFPALLVLWKIGLRRYASASS
jgi:ABC-2 type transport system permease protein